jgi:hypothetical protein
MKRKTKDNPTVKLEIEISLGISINKIREIENSTTKVAKL